jgi:hypothetical protein
MAAFLQSFLEINNINVTRLLLFNGTGRANARRNELEGSHALRIC